METDISIQDIKLFLADNLKFITITTLIITLLGMGLTTYFEISNYTSEQEKTTSIVSDETTVEVEELMRRDPEDLSANELQKVNDYLGEDSYYFRLFIEHPDYTSFGRTGLLYESMLVEDVIQYVEEETDISFSINPRYLIHLNYNSETFLHTVIFTAGSKENSQKLANVYFEMMTNGQIEILEDRFVYVLNDPTMIAEDEELTEEILPVQSEKSIIDSLISIVISGVVSIIFGFIAGSIIAIIRDKRSKKTIGYLDKIHMNRMDSVVKFKRNDNRAILHTLTQASTSDSVILTENMNVEKLRNQSEQLLDVEKRKRLNIFNNILDVNTNTEIQKVFIIVDINGTSKVWFNNQLNYVEAYNIPRVFVKIY